MAEVDSTYYDDVLQGIGAPVSPNNLRYLLAWQKAEGGKATWNAFNTTQAEPGATDYNGAGVKNYPDEATGIAATVRTLTNGRYTNLVNDLRADSDPTKTASEVDEISTWGTDPSVIQQALANMGAGVSIPTKVTQPVATTVGQQSTGAGSSSSSSSAPGKPVVDNQSIAGLVTEQGIKLLAAAAGATIVVLGLWKTVQPAAEKAKNAATSLATNVAAPEASPELAAG